MVEYFNVLQFLKDSVALNASDEHIMVGYPPFVRKNGFIIRTTGEPLTKEEVDSAILEIVPSHIRDEILTSCDKDFMFEIKGCSRFRVNYNRKLGQPAMVIRNIPYKIPSLEELNLPDLLQNFTDYHSGIILVTGPTGCGKSTTIASIINTINRTRSKHIVTIEDPVEYVFESQKCIISQRQVGIDTEDFSSGIKYALRQDPDVILVGEIRDQETMSAALKAAETGHLVLCTLHTNDAIQTINRIINMYEEQNRSIIRTQLAETLRATIAQKLVYSQKNKKRFPACEVMVVTSTIKDYLLKDNLDEVYELLKDNCIDNMISMNASLVLLVEAGFITEEEAISASNDPIELEKTFRGVYQGTKSYYE